jgi:hypothetical protein
MVTKRIAAAVVTVLGLGFGAPAAKAEHIDDLARTLERQSRALESEFVAHFRHASHFRHLISDAREMAGLAAHIHDVAHHGGSPYHLRSDLRKLDDLYHHLEGLVDHIEHDAYHGHGHVHGDTRHVRGLMRSISSTLHHLKADIERITDRGHGHSHGAGYGGRRVVGFGGGVSIGSGGFRIIIGR